VTGKTWFLDQQIPAGGFVRIQDSSQVWEEQVDELRIIMTESLTLSVINCLDSGRGWTIISRGWNFLKKQEHEQALITTIRKETNRTEELKQAAYRSPTWALLRVLQQINSGTRIEGEAAIRLPLVSFNHQGKEIYSSGGKKKDQVVIWESLFE